MDGIDANPEKVRAMEHFPRLTGLKATRNLELCSYYRRFVNYFALIAATLHKLQKKLSRLHGTTSSKNLLLALRKPWSQHNARQF